MVETNNQFLMDSSNGFCSLTKTYHTLRQDVPLPPPSQPLSITQFIFSHLHSTTTTSHSTFLINAATGHHLTYSDLIRQTNSLALSLQKHYCFSKGDVAFILAPHSFNIPILSFSLLSLGVIISPAMPDDSISDVNRLVNLCRPTIAFTTSHTSHKLPSDLPTVLIDSSEFLSLFTQYDSNVSCSVEHVVSQHDGAAIFFSSGTSGPRKGVLWTHKNLIVAVAATSKAYHDIPDADDLALSSTRPVSLTTRALTAVFGLTVLMRAVLMGETLVYVDNKFEIEQVLKAVEKYKVDYMPVSPSEILKLLKSELTIKYDLSSLKSIQCAGAPLWKEVAEKFRAKFPNIKLVIRYGLTETTGAVATMRRPEEVEQLGSVGRLVEFMEAKIVDPETDEALAPGQKGELWLRGPTILKGYVGDNEVNSETLDSEGWLKTGDLGYFDSQGFLFIVDRLKDVIKYNAIKIAPAELEDLLLSNPQIADAAVVPYPDEEAWQIPMAFVVRTTGSSITAAQVMDFVAKQVAPYKWIRRVAFIDSIPKSAAGKILRRDRIGQSFSLCLQQCHSIMMHLLKILL